MPFIFGKGFSIWNCRIPTACNWVMEFPKFDNFSPYLKLSIFFLSFFPVSYYFPSLFDDNFFTFN